MIRNEKEYRLAADRLRQEKKRLASYAVQLDQQSMSDADKERALAPLVSFHEQLDDEIGYYERIMRQEFGKLTNLHGLGTYLVALRISQGIDEETLAERLGIHVMEVIRDERDEYSGVTVERARQIMDALGGNLMSSADHSGESSD